MMMVKLRKVRGIPGGGPSSDLYEWQPEGSKRWYFINLQKIVVNNGHEDREKHEQYERLNHLYNAMLIGLEATVKASYDLNTKKLALDL